MRRRKPRTECRSRIDGFRASSRQVPVGPNEMAGVAAGVSLEVVLVLWLGLPKVAGRNHFGHRLAGPQARRIHVGDRVLGDALLLVARIEDRRPVARADVAALAVARARVVDLEEELEELTISDARGIEGDLDGFGVSRMVAIGGVGI